MSRAPRYTLFLTATEAVFDLSPKIDGEGEKGDGQVIRMAFDGAAPAPAIDTSDPRPGVTNYLSGNDPAEWVRNVPSFGRVTYRGVHPGIDLVFRGNAQDELEYDFVVAPGADPSPINLRFSGHDGLSVSGDGGLSLKTSDGGSLQQHAPFVYQKAQPGRDAVDAGFVVEGDGVRFRLGDYDRSRPLIIDPVIAYSTVLGGGNEDEATAIAVDSSGNAYVSGRTCSTDFPIAPAGRTSPPSKAGGCDGFVAKVSPDGSDLVYATYLGGNPPAEMPKPPTLAGPVENDSYRYEYHDAGVVGATGISIDSKGNAYVTGYTYADDFPVTANAFDKRCGNANEVRSCDTYWHTIYDGPTNARASSATTHVYWVPDAFLAKLDSTGSELTYSTYLGGAASGSANPPTRNSVGNDELDKQTPGAIGSPPQLASGTDVATSVAVDDVGGAYVTGYTTSRGGAATPGSHFPTTAKARDRQCGVDSGSWAGSCTDHYTPDGFLAHLDTTKALDPSLVYSSFVGGRGRDQANSVAWDPAAGTVVVAGSTNSDDLPVVQGVGLGQESGFGFVARFATRADTAPASMPVLTYFGPAGEMGDGVQPVTGVAVDPKGAVYLTGQTGFPTTHLATPARGGSPAPRQPTYQGNSDAYVAKLISTLSAVEYFTYLGGSGFDAAWSIAVDADGQAHVTGTTGSSQDFPLKEAFQRSMVGSSGGVGRSSFVTKLSADASDFIYSSYLGGSSAVSSNERIAQESGQGIAIGPDNHAFVAGRTPDSDFPTSVNSFQDQVFYVDAFVTRISPESSNVPIVAAINPKRGPTLGGTNVTIEGENFAGTTKVLFGDVEAPGPVVVNDTRITVNSPMQIAEKVVITVINASGRSLGLANSVTFSYDEGITIPIDPPTGYVNTPSSANVARLDRPDCQASVLPANYPCGKLLTILPVVGEPDNRTTILHARLYDPVSGTWSQRHCDYGPTCPAPAPQGGISGFSTRTLLPDGRVMFTGFDNDLLASTVDIYDPTTGLWENPTDLLALRESHTATLLSDGRVLIAGDAELEPGGVRDARAEVYDPRVKDPVTGRVGVSTFTGPLRQDRERHAAALLGGPPCKTSQPSSYCGKVVVVGGLVDDEVPGPVDRVEIYDPVSGTWTDESPATFARVSPGAFVQPDGKLVISGGHTGPPPTFGKGLPISQIEVYDPAVSDPAKRWTLGPPLAVGSYFGAVTLLGSGKLSANPPTAETGERMVLVPSDNPLRWRAAGRGFASHLLSGGGEFFNADPRICGWRCGFLFGLDTHATQAEMYIPAPTVTGFSPVAAPPGSEITVTGTGFTPRSRVLFAGQEATATVDAYGTLRAVVPPLGSRRDTRIMVVAAGGPAESVDSFRYTGTPGSVSPLSAVPTTDKLELRFRAAGSVADANPPATAYQLRRARTPITTAAEFEAADALRCPSATGIVDCVLEPANVADPLSVVIDPPPAGSVRWYAVRAMSDDGQVGPIAATRYGPDVDVIPDEVIDEVTTVTTPTSESCPPAAAPAPDQVAYAAGYSLVGLPAGTVVGAKSPLYSWLNLGAGGDYATSASSAPTEAGRGYWAWFACPSLVQLPGSGSDSAILALGAYRASMVGNPSAGPARVTGHDFAARWDPILNGGAGGYHMSGYRQAQDLAVGEGIWAFSFVPTELAIQRH
ncbi:MAG TPA: SBBP repeat-containing protein [Acidimicrobiales bacterium]|nr:SBBP repeat-containing protein [Acidimicrobiales bacterium]